MHLRSLPLVGLLAVSGFCGCQSPQPEAPAQAKAEKKSFDRAVFNNALALLDELLNEEKNLGKILIVKHHTSELKALVVSISKTSANGADLLKSIAKKDPGLDFKETNLPPGERAARKAIAKTKEHLLLDSKDQEFEFQLLLTQSEALNYGAHLATVAAENDPQPARAGELSALAGQLRQLHEQVLAMLRKGG